MLHCVDVRHVAGTDPSFSNAQNNLQQKGETCLTYTLTMSLEAYIQTVVTITMHGPDGESSNGRCMSPSSS